MKAAIGITVVLVAVCYGGWYFLNSQKPALPPGATEPDTFAACVKYYPEIGGYPRRCVNGAGVTVTEDVGNAPELRDTIQVSIPAPGDVVSSPLFIKGQAMEEWYDDNNSVTAAVLDANGAPVGNVTLDSKTLVSYGHSHPFEGTISFRRPSNSATGIVIIKKYDSNLTLRIPVVFK